MPGRDEAADRGGDHLERLLHLRGGAASRRRRVVQLVGEAGGHRAERREPLAVLLHAGDRGSSPAPTCCITRWCTAGWAKARRRKSSDSITTATRQGGLGLHANAERPAGEHGDRAHPGRGVLAPDRLLAVPFDQRSPAPRPRAAASARAAPRPARTSSVARLERLDASRRRPTRPAARRRGRRRGRPRAARRAWPGAHAFARYWWISETAIEPSPTALATRLIERARTSPATKIPGTLVSSG